jgi:O-antigen/teichoic acid export membrane protein
LFPFVLVAIAFAHEGLSLWVGESIASHSAAVLRWLALGVFMNGLAQVPFATIQAAGRPDLTARIHLIELPLYLPTLWWMAHRWGIEGAAVAWMLRGGFDLAAQFLVANHLLPERGGASRVNSNALIAVGFAVITFAGAALVPGLPTRAAVVFLALVAFVALGWTRILDAEQRAYARDIAARATARFRIA